MFRMFKNNNKCVILCNNNLNNTFEKPDNLTVSELAGGLLTQIWKFFYLNGCFFDIYNLQFRVYVSIENLAISSYFYLHK